MFHSRDNMPQAKVLICLIFLMSFQNCVDGDKSDVVSAIKQIVFSANRHDVYKINLLNGIKNQSSREVNDFITEIARQIGSKVSFREIFIKGPRATVNRMFFNLMLFDSIESFRQIIKNVTSNRFHFGGYFLVVFENATISNMKEMFQTFWDMYIHNIDVVSNSNGSISVSTFVPFSELGCNRTDPIKFAEFKNGSFIYRPEMFFPDKLLNFHKCKIKVTTFESLSPSVLRQDFANGTFKLYGRDVDVIDTLADQFNFHLDIHYIIPLGGWGDLYPNGTATGAIGQAIRREADFIINNLLLKYDRAKVMDFSYTYFLDDLILVIPAGKLLTSFQKLVRPFEIFTWLFFGGAILFGFTIITYLQFQSATAREFVYGKDVHNPYLNLVVVIFGGSQHLLPKRNFSRFLLMVFILFCLVIR